MRQQMADVGIDTIVVLLSEIFPDKLRRFEDVDAWVQVCKHRREAYTYSH